MDGTLARFHDSSNYLERMYEPGFFAKLKPFGNAVKGIKELMKDYPQIEVFTISACIDSPFCVKEKNDWLNKHLPQIDEAHRIFPPAGADKSKYIPGGIKSTDSLLDDYNRNLEQWQKAGGNSIKFVNNINNQGKHGRLWDGETINYKSHSSLISFQLAEKTNTLPSFENQIQYAIENKFARRDAIFVCNTPEVLQKVGCKPLPMFLTQNHLKNMIHEKSSENRHWHGLSVEQIKKLPELLQEPAIVFDSISKNQTNGIVLVLNDVDTDGLPLLAAIQPNGSGSYMLKQIDSNFITSVYGRTNFENHILNVSKQEKVLYLGKKSSQSLIAQAQLQLLWGHNQPGYDNIISSDKNIVNSYYMQNEEKKSIERINSIMENKALTNEEFKELTKELEDIAKTYQNDPELMTEFLAFKAQFYQYSERNAMLIHLQNPHSTFVASFQKWKEMGYSINKGEKHMKITRPIEKLSFLRAGEYVDVKQATNDEKAKIAKGDIKTEKQTIFVPHQVFDISQTNCPKEDYPKIYSMGMANVEHAQLYECVKEYAKQCGFDFTEQKLDSISLCGYYDKANNSIVINSSLEDTKRLRTACHELAHGVLHKTSTQPTEIKELEAECFGAMLKRKMGLPVDESSKGYISDYYKKCAGTDFKMSDMFSRLSNSLAHVSKGIDDTVKARGIDLEQTQSHDKQQSKNKAVDVSKISENFIQNL